ncbi:MAG TPA: hypothetical protein VF599_10365 [Pyrinomonadaceae bacterium]|jgi:hypothetical protein
MKKSLEFNLKKFLGFYLPAFITIFSLAILLFGYLFVNHPLLLRFSVGKSRVISPRVEAVVKVNGVEQPESGVFSMDGGDKLLVYAPNSKETYPVIIVDKLKNDIGSTNAVEKEDYELFFDRFLFQSENAYGLVYASDTVKWGYNPKLQITGERISYVTPNYKNEKHLQETSVEIIFKGAK